MVNKFFNCCLLGVILILLIYIILQRENFQEHINEKENKKKTIEDEVKYINNIAKNKKPVTKKEKYYDYNYIVNNSPTTKTIKVPYPVKVDKDRNLTNLLNNTIGTPIDQVFTPYSVRDKYAKKYKDWDRYYLSGYSYFPPSKWHIPVDNKLKFPQEYYKETNVCPLTVNNVWSEFLSGDEVGKQMEEFKKSQTTPNA